MGKKNYIFKKKLQNYTNAHSIPFSILHIREILTIQSDNMNQLDCIFNIYNKMGKKV